MSTTHTPGPWHQLHRQPLCIESPSGNVALCNLARSNEADARLIAAAPELRALVERLHADHVRTCHFGERVSQRYCELCKAVAEQNS